MALENASVKITSLLSVVTFLAVGWLGMYASGVESDIEGVRELTAENARQISELGRIVTRQSIQIDQLTRAQAKNQDLIRDAAKSAEGNSRSLIRIEERLNIPKHDPER